MDHYLNFSFNRLSHFEIALVLRRVTIRTKLIIEQLVLTAHLGWSEKEREHTQQVWVDLQIDYLTVPTACTNDELTDTDCYYQLSLVLQAVCDAKPYCLLESLAHQLFQATKRTLKAKTRIRLSLAKNPPMDNLQRVYFVIADE